MATILGASAVNDILASRTGAKYVRSCTPLSSEHIAVYPLKYAKELLYSGTRLTRMRIVSPRRVRRYKLPLYTSVIRPVECDGHLDADDKFVLDASCRQVLGLDNCSMYMHYAVLAENVDELVIESGDGFFSVRGGSVLYMYTRRASPHSLYHVVESYPLCLTFVAYGKNSIYTCHPLLPMLNAHDSVVSMFRSLRPVPAVVGRFVHTSFVRLTDLQRAIFSILISEPDILDTLHINDLIGMFKLSVSRLERVLQNVYAKSKKS